MRLRLALEDFAAYWCDSTGASEARIKELIAAQKALCFTGPLRPLPERHRHSGHVGGRGGHH